MSDKIIIRKWRSHDHLLTGWEVWSPDCQIRDFAHWAEAIAYADRLAHPR